MVIFKHDVQSSFSFPKSLSMQRNNETEYRYKIYLTVSSTLKKPSKNYEFLF